MALPRGTAIGPWLLWRSRSCVPPVMGTKGRPQEIPSPLEILGKVVDLWKIWPCLQQKYRSAWVLGQPRSQGAASRPRPDDNYIVPYRASSPVMALPVAYGGMILEREFGV